MQLTQKGIQPARLRTDEASDYTETTNIPKGETLHLL